MAGRFTCLNCNKDHDYEDAYVIMQGHFYHTKYCKWCYKIRTGFDIDHILVTLSMLGKAYKKDVVDRIWNTCVVNAANGVEVDPLIMQQIVSSGMCREIPNITNRINILKYKCSYLVYDKCLVFDLKISHRGDIDPLVIKVCQTDDGVYHIRHDRGFPWIPELKGRVAIQDVIAYLK